MANRVRFLLALAVLPASLASQAPSRLSGTYALWLCEKTCTAADTSNAEVSGFLVLDDFGLDLARIPLKARYKIRESSYALVESREINACFSLRRRDPKRLTMMAGIIPEGLTTWTRKGDTLNVGLYASPDAFYTLHAAIGHDRLSGNGYDSGFIGDFFSKSSGVPFAIRIGPPDVGKCFSPELVQKYESGPAPSDSYERDQIGILTLLERRDEGRKKHDARLAASAYSEGATLIDEFGTRYTSNDSIVAYYQRRTPTPDMVRRRDWPLVLTLAGGKTAYVEEYLESAVPAAKQKASRVRRSRRISILFKTTDANEWSNGWIISREITLDERDRGR